MRFQDFSRLRTAHHKLLLRIIGSRRKGRTGYKPLSFGEIFERTGSERIERQLFDKAIQGSQSESCFGRLAVKRPNQRGLPATSWVDYLRKHFEVFGTVPRKDKGRKWVAFGVVSPRKDGIG